MHLNEYFDEVGIPKSEFARRCGIHVETVKNILRGRDVRLSVALKIEKETKGQVQPHELLYDCQKAKLSRKKVKKTA